MFFSLKWRLSAFLQFRALNSFHKHGSTGNQIQLCEQEDEILYFLNQRERMSVHI